MFKLRRFLTDYKKECIIGPLCKLFEAVLELFVPLVMANIIDVGINTLHDGGYVLRMGALLVLLAVTGLSSALFCQYFASRASQGAGTKIRRELYKHISSLSYSELDALGTPSLITRITNDVNQVQASIAMTIRLLTRAPFIIIGSLVMAMTINLKLSLIFFAAALLIGITLFLIMKLSVPVYSLIAKKLDKTGLITRENLAGNRVIRAFSKQDAENKKVDKATDELVSASLRVGRLSALLNPVTYAVTDLAIIAIVWFGAVEVNAGGMRTGDIVALVSYMTQILLAMIVVANLVILMTRSSASAKRINEVFETQPGITEKTHDYISVKEDKSVPKIEFKNVSFAYPNSDEALSNFSFKLERGSTVGIIGATGSGKTTLINLIPRFYDANSGSVLVDGVDVRDYPFEQLRRQMGIVPQQSILFSGTVRSNLLWQNPDAKENELVEALRIAQAYEFVSRLPNGLDARIEQGGKNLSGGQRQRLCIARAIVSRPKLLILDDSFSALDLATDAALRKALKQTVSGMTTLIATQRCSSVMNADKILVLGDGRPEGFGSHEELLESCQTYRDIYYSQNGGEREHE